MFPFDRGDFIANNPGNLQQLFKIQEDQYLKLAVMTITYFKNQLKSIAESQLSDPLLADLIVDVSSGVVKEDFSLDISTNLLLFKEQIYVPENPSLKLKIFRLHHNAPLSGNFGQDKTYALIALKYYWPGMSKDVCPYIKSCYLCTRSKSLQHKKYSLLQPLPVATIPLW